MPQHSILNNYSVVWETLQKVNTECHDKDYAMSVLLVDTLLKWKSFTYLGLKINVSVNFWHL